MSRDDAVPEGVEDLPRTSQEILTEQFYGWEKRGRGWQVWDYPVPLEPPFRPFFFHSISPVATNLDDARKPTMLSAFIERLIGRSQPPPPAPPVERELPEPELERFASDSPIIEVQVSLPPTLKVARDAAERFLICLPEGHGPIAFEVLGEPDQILLQFACREEDLAGLREQLRAQFPEAVLTEHSGYLAECWDRSGNQPSRVVDFGLSQEFMLPLEIAKGFEVDPLAAVAGALADLRMNEVGLLQVLFEPCRNPWGESIFRAVTDGAGHAFFVDAPAMLPLAKEKIARPLFAAVMRVAAQSPSSRRATEIARALAGALRQFATPPGNELIPLDDDGYPQDAHEEDLLLRQSRRSGMILNSEELVSLVHLPSAAVRSEKLLRETKRTKAAPAMATRGRLVLGENVHRGEHTEVALTPDQRMQHTYVVGASGTGKSTLLLNLIHQDLQHGDGFAVLDPHGDLIDDILGLVPPERIPDVILLDPSDEEFPVGFNILSAHSDIEKNLLASDLVSVFRRLSTSWGDQMTSVLGNAVLAFLESDEGGTLLDLRRFLIERDFRRRFLATVRDPEVVYFWEREFPLLSGKPQAPLLTRLDTFLRPKLLRYMVAQKENRLDFAGIMDEGKIVLAKLAQGAIGEENAYLLGTLLVSKFHQLALSRQAQDAAERRPFYLYIDEFHNFITPSMAQILTGARKYRLGLTLAHQDLRQIGSRDMDVAGAIQSLYTRVCFRVGEQDAKRLQEGFSSFDATDLQNLGIGEAVCRIERAEFDFNLRTPPQPAVEPSAARERQEQVIERSRERYGRPRDEVEAVLLRTLSEAPRARPVPQRSDEATSAPPAPAMPPKPSTPPPAVPAPVTAPLPGRGGRQHKYLQQLIKRWAESRGWRATIEKQVLAGAGSVDVALERGGVSVACEISVTSAPEHELGNVRKCLAAGFDHVIVVSAEPKRLQRFEHSLSSGLDERDRSRVRCLDAAGLFEFLEQLEADAMSEETTARGYTVRVRQRPLAEDEKGARRQAISRVLFRALKRLRPKGEER